MNPVAELAEEFGQQLRLELEHALEDVAQQREQDRRPPHGGQQIEVLGPRTPTSEYLRVRIRNVLEAAEQGDQPYALRQSLIDLAALSVEAAAMLPRPKPIRRPT